MDEAFARFWGQVLLHSVHSIPCYQSLCLSQASDSRTTCLPRSRHKSKTDNKSPCVLKNSFFGAERWGWKFSGAARTHRQAGEKKKEHVFVLLLFPLCVRIPIRHGAAVKYCVRNICFRFGTTSKQRRVRFWRVSDTQRDETHYPVWSKLASRGLKGCSPSGERGHLARSR